MTIMGDVHRHFWLTVGMSRRLGADLNGAIHAEKLTTSDYADMVTRCRSCAWADECESWQKSHPGAETSAPEQCINKDIWDHLRAI